jgi:hypothetical protein
VSKNVLVLICRGQSFPVQKEVVMKQLMLFRGRPELLTEGSNTIQCGVAAEFVPEFVRAIQGEQVRVTETNICSLSALCDEFDFPSLRADCESFLEHNPNLVQNCRLVDVEERITRQDVELAMIQNQLPSLSSSISAIRQFIDDAHLDARLTSLMLGSLHSWKNYRLFGGHLKASNFIVVVKNIFMEIIKLLRAHCSAYHI